MFQDSGRNDGVECMVNKWQIMSIAKQIDIRSAIDIRVDHAMSLILAE